MSFEPEQIRIEDIPGTLLNRVAEGVYEGELSVGSAKFNVQAIEVERQEDGGLETVNEVYRTWKAELVRLIGDIPELATFGDGRVYLLVVLPAVDMNWCVNWPGG